MILYCIFCNLLALGVYFLFIFFSNLLCIFFNYCLKSLYSTKNFHSRVLQENILPKHSILFLERICLSFHIIWQDVKETGQGKKYFWKVHLIQLTMTCWVTLWDKNIIEKPVRNSNQQNQENSSIPQMHVTVQPFLCR